MIYLTLFYEFFKAGLFAVGGGLATLPFLYEMAEKYPWFDKATLIDMIAVSESTPGPIGVNMATYAGFSGGALDGSILSGIFGGIIATIGLVFPSVVIILIVAGFLNKFKENRLVDSAFYGLRPAVCGLISAATFEIIKVTLINPEFTGNLINFIRIKELILFAVIFTALKKFKLHPIVYILVAGVIGGFIL
ncbi:MAG: chromate transporter [Ruminococcaceae bacterium]|nr:chromate transporter [Oscillospiraceae bacterium]